MRFLLYNLRYCAGTARNFNFPIPGQGYLRHSVDNLQEVVRFIKSHKPDIVGLVEADVGSYRTKKQNQVEVIAKSLGHYHCYKSKYGAGSLVGKLPVIRKHVNAFLTNDKIKGSTFHYFRKGIKRLVIELELSGLTIFLVHLSLRYRYRRHQLADLYELVRRVKKPHIVAGDFNLFRGARELARFLEATGMKDANTDKLPSHPSWLPIRHLDFILHSPEIEITRFDMPRVELSDHLPLICDFEIL